MCNIRKLPFQYPYETSETFETCILQHRKVEANRFQVSGWEPATSGDARAPPASALAAACEQLSTTSTGLGLAGQAARTTGGSRLRARREGGSEMEWGGRCKRGVGWGCAVRVAGGRYG
jgi:hypothetical protein